LIHQPAVHVKKFGSASAGKAGSAFELGTRAYPLETHMWEFLSWLFFIAFIGGLVIVGGLLLKGYLAQEGNAGKFTGSFFGPKPDKRLDVVDQANVDGRRRLVLVRRDEVEHLIMTGGPVDVVIETNIESNTSPNASHGRHENGKVQSIETNSSGSFSRPARAFSKTAE
jgi:flagellar protein FliO/FliZ